MSKARHSVLVLHEALGADARRDELDALVQVREIGTALETLDHDSSVLATGLDLDTTLAAIESRRPWCVFNLVESLAGQGRLVHLVPAVLEAARVRFTGSGADAVMLSSQKLLAKQWLRHHGIATPPWFVPGMVPRDRTTQWIVKSVWEHASFGLDDGCVVAGTRSAETRMRQSADAHGGDWFAERFIDGREFNVAVLEVGGRPEVLPIAEMTFVDHPEGKPRIVGYAAKWDEEAPEYRATQRDFDTVSETDRRLLTEMALECWRAFGLRGYARVDFRMDAEGVPWVLEVNANPCLSADAGFVAAAAAAGMTQAAVVEALLLAANESARAKRTRS